MNRHLFRLSFSFLCLPAVLLCCIASPSQATTFKLLDSFRAQTPSDPSGPLVQDSESSLYGVTSHGQSNFGGAIFKLTADGTKQAVLHEFTGTDGANPTAGLVLSGTTLYGATTTGTDGATLFKINTDGTGFAVLHTFATADYAGGPRVALTIIGSTLYGTTYGPYYSNSGGIYQYGTLFKIGMDGSGFTLLHAFNNTDGAYPDGTLILSGTTLYGTTASGGHRRLERPLRYRPTELPSTLCMHSAVRMAVGQWEN